MIKSITVTNFKNERLTLELDKPWNSGFYVKEVDGLGPTKANINTTEFSGSDGGEFNSARAEIKNITLSLGLLQNPDIETMRQLSYKYFPLKKKLTLTVETDNRKASIDGYVESNEPDIFSENESIQISIICPNPWWYSEDTISVFRGTEYLFEFPYSNEGFDPVTDFGEQYSTRYRIIDYEGDVDCGVTMLMHATGFVNGRITVANTTHNEVLYIDLNKVKTIMGTDYGLKVGDEILVNTTKGERYITLYRDALYYNILNAIPRGCSWLQLYHGENRIGYSVSDGLENMEFRILNKTLYEGM